MLIQETDQNKKNEIIKVIFLRGFLKKIKTRKNRGRLILN